MAIDSVDIQVTTYASMAILGNLGLILTWMYYREWRNVMPSAKILLVTQCSLESFGLTSYLWFDRDNDAACTFQAITVQCGWMGSSLLNGVLAVEMSFLCYKIFAASASHGGNVGGLVRLNSKVAMWNRFFCYFCWFIPYELALAIWMISTPSATSHTFADKYCWLATPEQRMLLGYLPLWIAIAVNIVCVSFVLLTIYSEYRLAEMSSTTSSRVSSSGAGARAGVSAGAGAGAVVLQQAMSTRSSLAVKVVKKFARVIADCSLFALIWIPGSIRRGSMGDIDSPELQNAHNFVVSYGFWKFCIWVLLDEKVNLFWANKIRASLGYPPALSAKEKEKAVRAKQLHVHGNIEMEGSVRGSEAAGMRESSIQTEFRVSSMTDDLNDASTNANSNVEDGLRSTAFGAGTINPIWENGDEDVGCREFQGPDSEDSDDDDLFRDLEDRETLQSTHSAK
jgi:hypothetical protein